MKFAALAKSIRWRLLLWIALLLGLVLAALDFAFYEIHFASSLSQLDERLRQRVTSLSISVSAPGPSRIFGRSSGSNENPPRGEFNSGPPTGRPPFDAAWVATVANRFERADTNAFYIVIWASGLATPGYQSTNHSAAVPHPELREHDPGTYARTRDGCREMFHETEHGDCILLGQTLAPALADAQQFAGLLAFGSLVVLAFGLGGVWFIIAAALRPVERISAAATKISSGDLSQRINVAETESELGQLAAVLNSTFARLDAAFARQKQFTADAAHELRTPVTVMLTHTQNGLAGGCTNDEHLEAFAACQRAAQRMRRLIESLLALARFDDGQSTGQRAKFDLAQVARECLDLVRPLAAARRVMILIEVPPLEISGDAEQLAQVITNLCTNAIQYNREGGRLKVKLEQDGNHAVLTVNDTGAGIAAEDLPHVFERFYRGDKTRSSGGLGLGLAISKSIVVAHRGTIEVASQPEIGTTFTVRLPMPLP